MNSMSSTSSRWVPITQSTSPVLSPSITVLACAGREEAGEHLDADRVAARSGRRRCCRAAGRAGWSGTSTATCLPSWMALNAARMATSVLPKPTSPQTQAVHRVAGLHVALHVVRWPSAGRGSPRTGSSPPARAATACRRPKAMPGALRRRWYSTTSSWAISRHRGADPALGLLRSRRRRGGGARATRRRRSGGRRRSGRTGRRACRRPCTRGAGSRARRRRSCA